MPEHPIDDNRVRILSWADPSSYFPPVLWLFHVTYLVAHMVRQAALVKKTGRVVPGGEYLCPYTKKVVYQKAPLLQVSAGLGWTCTCSGCAGMTTVVKWCDTWWVHAHCEACAQMWNQGRPRPR